LRLDAAGGRVSGHRFPDLSLVSALAANTVIPGWRLFYL